MPDSRSSSGVRGVVIAVAENVAINMRQGGLPVNMDM
jgi:hypothetical protein